MGAGWAFIVSVNKFQFFASLGAVLLLAPVAEADYDPLAVDANFRAQSLELTVHDAKRDRDIPVRVYLPQSGQRAAVILFSHENALDIPGDLSFHTLFCMCRVLP